MEVWVYIIAAVWLIKYARGRVVLTEPFRQSRYALILFSLWLGYGLLQMPPLPATVVAAISPNTAELYKLAQLGPQLANHDLEPNPVSLPLPSFPDRPDPAQEFADTIEIPPDALPTATVSARSARLTLDLTASTTAWLKSLAYVLLFVLTLLLVDSTQRLKTLAYVLVLSGLGQAVYGSLALAIAGGGNASGTFVNRNHFAAYLVLCLATGIGLLIASMGRRTRAGSWRDRLQRIGTLILSAKAPLRIFLAIMVIALVLTHSRMGNTSFFASLLITATLALFLFRDMPRPVVVLITSLIVIDIFIIGSWVGLEQVRERLAETTLAGESRDEFGMHSFRMWQDYPLFGTGAGSFYGVYPRYRVGDTSSGLLVDHAHNDYLEFLSEYGILGILFPAGIVILALRNAILAQRKRRSQFARGIGFAATMAITAMLIHATVEFNLQIPAYAATFMVILATAWLARHLKSD
jgi:O-antigen ligase